LKKIYVTQEYLPEKKKKKEMKRVYGCSFHEEMQEMQEMREQEEDLNSTTKVSVPILVKANKKRKKTQYFLHSSGVNPINNDGDGDGEHYREVNENGKIYQMGVTIPAPEKAFQIKSGKIHEKPQYVTGDTKTIENLYLNKNPQLECQYINNKTIAGVNVLSVADLETYLAICERFNNYTYYVSRNPNATPSMVDFAQILAIMNKLVPKEDAMVVLKKRKSSPKFLFGGFATTYAFSITDSRKPNSKV
jgi:hypothetical protein